MRPAIVGDALRIPMMSIIRSEVMAISAERSEGRNTRVRQGVEKEERRQVPVGSARVTISTRSSALFVLPCAPSTPLRVDVGERSSPHR